MTAVNRYFLFNLSDNIPIKIEIGAPKRKNLKCVYAFVLYVFYIKIVMYDIYIFTLLPTISITLWPRPGYTTL